MFFRTYIINFLFFGLVLLLLLIFSELALRLVHSYNDTNPVSVEADQILPYRMIPNTETTSIDGIQISINSDGLRDIKPETNQSSVIKNYLVLGDSTTYGYGVQASHTFAERLQDVRNKKNPDTNSFINAGHAGFNIIDYANLLSILNEKIEYDTIIVSMDSSDYTTTSVSLTIKNEVGIGRGSLLDRYNVNPWLIKLFRNSAIYLTVGNAIKGNNYKSKPSSEKAMNNQYLIATIKNSLEKIKKIANTRRAPVFLFYLPVKTELLDLEVHYPKFNATVKEFADRHTDVYFLDLSKKSVLIDNVERIYFRTDWVHPNPLGHRMFCSEMLRFINEHETNASNQKEC